MKPAHDPNRQQPTTPVRPPVPNVRVTSASSATPHSSAPTNVTSHIVSTGNPAIKTIPVTTARVAPHTNTATLTLVGSGAANIRPVSTVSGITTSFHVSKVPTTVANIAGARTTVASPMMRNIVTTPVVPPAGSVTSASFVPGIRTLPRPPSVVTTTGPTSWATGTASKGTPTATKITTSLPSFQAGGPMPRAAAATSLTVTTRPVAVTAPQTKPELATLRTTKPAGPAEKFIRTPQRTLAFTTTAAGQTSGQFATQGGTSLTHLAVAAPLQPGGQATGTALTLQPIVVSTTNTTGATKAGAAAGTPGRHPIGPKVITQPAHGHIITHLTGVGGKPGAAVAASPRGPVPQTQAGTQFTTAPGSTQVKVLTQAPGTILTDVLSQQGATTTTLIPSGSVFIQAAQHTAVNVTPLERGTVVTSASYTLPASYIYDATASGGSLIAAAQTHQAIVHPGTSHQLIRTFTPSMLQSSMHIQQQPGSFQQTEADSSRKSAFASNLNNPAVTSSSMTRFNPVMVMDTGARLPSTSQTENQGDGHHSQHQQQPASAHSSSTPVGQQLQHASATPQPVHQSVPSQSQVFISTTASQQHSSSQQPTQQAVCSQPSTPTSTPSKFCASPRPSILRKREHDGTPSKVQKNLGPMLAALLPSSGNSSPPPSPPGRPDSRDGGGKEGSGAHSSAGSSTISATSSPGIPCDGDNNNGSQCSITVKSEPIDVADGASNNGANGNSDIMSPRKKPRKQQLTGNELQEPHYSDENAEFADDNVKRENNEANPKVGQDGSAIGTPTRPAGASMSARRRPSVSLLQTYRTCWKPRNNHFLRPTDVKPREERRPTVAELSSQKRVMQRAQGWKLHHLSTQMEDMAQREADMLNLLSGVLETMEKSGTDVTSKDLNLTNELIRSNMQRSKVVRDQLEECRIQLLRLLDHTTPVVDIIKRNANRRQAKKKY